MRRPADPDSVRLARGCWLSPTAAAHLAGRCAAAIETSTDYTVVSSVTAARLHGMWLPRLPDDIHLATATPDRAGRAMSRTRRPEFIAHRYQLGEGDLDSIDGVQVTSRARTWCDLGRVLGLADMVAAGDSALAAGVGEGGGALGAGATLEQLTAAATRGVRSPHLARARAALPLLDRRSRSRAESHLRVAVSAADLPRFEVNEAVFRREGGWLAEPDLSLAAARVALEYQGAEHADKRRMRKDLTRFADLRRDGWLVLAYGPAQVFGRPWEVRADTRQALRDRAAHLLGPRRPTRPRTR